MFIISDLLSLVPSFSSSGVAAPPTLGSPAPKDPRGRLNFPLKPARPLVLLIPRHCGCPFAERDVHALVHLVLDNPGRFMVSSPSSDSPVPVTFLIVTHSDLTSSRAWFAAVLDAAFTSYTPPSPNSPAPDSSLIANHFSLFPDPSGALPSAYGIGSLPSYSSLFSKTMWAEIARLKEEKGVVNRTTGGGSDRWKAHGVAVMDGEGTVRGWWKAEKAEEEGNWEGLVKSLGI